MMPKTKLKPDQPPRLGFLPFVILWALTYAGGWFAALGLLSILDRLTSSELPHNTIAITGVLMLPALLQVPLVERGLNRTMRGWLWATAAGMLITQVTFVNGSPSDGRFFLTLLSLLLPVALIQTLWLWRQRVRSAWLWPLASVAATVMFTQIMTHANNSSSYQMILLGAAALYGLVQGAIFHHLRQQPSSDEKAKTDARRAGNEESRAARLSLETHQAVIAPWSVADTPTAQTQERERGR